MSVTGVGSSGSVYYEAEMPPISLEVFLQSFLDFSDNATKLTQEILDNLVDCLDPDSQNLLKAELKAVIQAKHPEYREEEVEGKLKAILELKQFVIGLEEAQMMTQALCQATEKDLQGYGSDSSEDSIFGNIRDATPRPSLPAPNLPARRPDSPGHSDDSVIIDQLSFQSVPRRDIFADGFDSANDESASGSDKEPRQYEPPSS